MTTVFCIEILGESPVHKFLVQSGWSGKDYVFFYNRHTGSHLRAYRDIADYRAERVDMHKSANIWPLLGNLLPLESVEPHLFVQHGEAAQYPQAPHIREEASEPNSPASDAAPSTRVSRKSTR